MKVAQLPVFTGILFLRNRSCLIYVHGMTNRTTSYNHHDEINGHEYHQATDAWAETTWWGIRVSVTHVNLDKSMLHDIDV